MLHYAVPRIGLQEAARASPQGPSPAACSTVVCVHKAMLKLLLTSEHVFHANIGCPAFANNTAPAL
ncbi:hypothetical protein HaLaN_23614 [Haematococcus lacustris]|uniref:Uncharacterized protein n=1 Tax=Haematococcus lacustris TaxID=44745 RepID=A0A699ZWP7_HAELA|nr:hypothetical protein HaLaN_23614 [Haematococcus lacustris]